MKGEVSLYLSHVASAFVQKMRGVGVTPGLLSWIIASGLKKRVRLFTVPDSFFTGTKTYQILRASVHTQARLF